MVVICSMQGVMNDAHKILVGKREGEKSLGKPSRRWVDTP